MTAAHFKLVEKMTLAELQRKADKAMRKGIYTIETIDLATRKGEILALELEINRLKYGS